MSNTKNLHHTMISDHVNIHIPNFKSDFYLERNVGRKQVRIKNKKDRGNNESVFKNICPV